MELARLVAAYPTQGMGDVSSELRTEAYFEALDGLPLWAIREARSMIIHGETEFGKPWGPGPTEFAELVRTLLTPAKRDLAMVEALLVATPIDDDPPPEEKARVVAGFEKLKVDLGALKA